MTEKKGLPAAGLKNNLPVRREVGNIYLPSYRLPGKNPRRTGKKIKNYQPVSRIL